jgi:thiamine-phosphate pyrophosphorylase
MLTSHFSIIIITPEVTQPGEIEVLRELINDYTPRIHIRKPSFTEQEYRKYLKAFDLDELKRVVIHEHHQLAYEFPTLSGIHWKEETRKNSGKADKRGGVVSSSFHTLEEIHKEGAAFEYVFLSPIFDSISKSGHVSNFTLETCSKELETLHQQHPSLKVMALGGITEKNIKSVKFAGFDGAALIGAFWQAENPVEYYHRLVLSL